MTTYTRCIDAVNDGRLPLWAHSRAPPMAIDYYGLNPETASMKDVLLAVRADEAVHRSVNHHFGDIPQFYDVAHEEV